MLPRETAEFCGFSEGMTFSFESPKVFDKLRLDADDPLRQAITIANPQGEDYSIMKYNTFKRHACFSGKKLQPPQQRCEIIRNGQDLSA